MTDPNQGVDVRRRFKLARRVQGVLGALEGVTSARIDDEIPSKLRDEAQRGDFLIQALDLRLRLILLVGAAPTGATLSADVANRAAALLTGSPDSDAAVLVFDDETLTAVIVEPFDLSGAVTVPSGAPGLQTVSEGPGELASVLGDYLRLLRINWAPASSLGSDPATDLGRLAHDAADAAIAERKRQVYHVPEKLQAQAKLSADDTGWVADLVLEVARNGSPADLADQIRERGGPS
jgi:hypothetical protein